MQNDEEKQKSFEGFVIDNSNWLGGTNKIFEVIHGNLVWISFLKRIFGYSEKELTWAKLIASL